MTFTNLFTGILLVIKVYNILGTHDLIHAQMQFIYELPIQKKLPKSIEPVIKRL